ncbi:MAG: hypothetical protein PHT60_10060 [Acidiphilium sp.]|nr:hypothetical protein [Acidiphilium sp.]MDD4936107.1 hypothetical protein [Acidiphilium sp.]
MGFAQQIDGNLAPHAAQQIGKGHALGAQATIEAAFRGAEVAHEGMKYRMAARNRDPHFLTDQTHEIVAATVTGPPPQRSLDQGTPRGIGAGHRCCQYLGSEHDRVDLGVERYIRAKQHMILGPIRRANVLEADFIGREAWPEHLAQQAHHDPEGQFRVLPAGDDASVAYPIFQVGVGLITAQTQFGLFLQSWKIAAQGGERGTERRRTGGQIAQIPDQVNPAR